MTKDEALKIALEALEDVQDMMTTSDWFNDRVQAVRQALDQSPDTTKMSDNLTKAKQYLTQGALVPVDIETTTLLLDALSQALKEPPNSTTDVVEPVAWIVPDYGFLFPNEDSAQRYLDNIESNAAPTPLYTAPPKREWVGLTDEEREYLWSITPIEDEDRFAFVLAVEAKLKEKNT
jgi:hypothetical protein